MEGPLSKWTNVVHGWQYRWFVLSDESICYYTSREKMLKRQQRGCIRLRGAVVGIDGEDTSLFTLTVDGKTFHLQVCLAPIFRFKFIRFFEVCFMSFEKRYKCVVVSEMLYNKEILILQGRDEQERNAWVRCLESTIHKLSGYYRPSPISPGNLLKGKIVEADKHLQNMIKEVRFSTFFCIKILIANIRVLLICSSNFFVLFV